MDARGSQVGRGRRECGRMMGHRRGVLDPKVLACSWCGHTWRMLGLQSLP